MSDVDLGRGGGKRKDTACYNDPEEWPEEFVSHDAGLTHLWRHIYGRAHLVPSRTIGGEESC